MHLDARGLPLSTASAKAAAAFDHLVAGYLTYRADTPDRLPPCWKPTGLRACSLHEGLFRHARLQAGRRSGRRPGGAHRAVARRRATPRERAHIAALTAWAEGELDRAIAVWESILRSHPHDVRRLPSRPFRQFLARPPAGHGRLRRARDPGLVGGHPRLSHRYSPAAASPRRRPGTISPPSPPGAAPSSSTPAISGPRTPSPM